MKILITGGAGFLGSHLTQTFLDDDHKVTAIDDFTTGSRENIKEFLTNPKYSFIEHDVREPFDLETDLILNFACPASPGHYQADPVKTIETNFLGMANTLKLAKKNKSQVLQASTSEVYGDPKVTTQTEEYWGNVNPIGIRSCYDEGKRAAETLCFDYMRQHDLDVRVVRIFNTYGPRMALNDGRVVSNFIIQAIQNQPITIFGEGQQTRSFCYVDDLIRGIKSVALHPKSISTPLNIGNPAEFTILELAKLVIEITESKSTLVFHSLPPDDPMQRKPDISQINSLIGWSPGIELLEGLTRSISYFRKMLIK
jgi:UDP-glucuronate decarboxylase